MNVQHEYSALSFVIDYWTETFLECCFACSHLRRLFLVPDDFAV